MDSMVDAFIWFGYLIAGFVWKIFHLHKLESARKERLLQILKNPRYKWRSLSVLSANIAADRDTTKKLLVQLGARQQGQAPYYWGLIERTGEA